MCLTASLIYIGNLGEQYVGQSGEHVIDIMERY